MTRSKLQELIDEFSDNSPINYLGNSGNRTPEELERFGELKGMRFFDRPVFSIGRADNPGFAILKQPEVVGEQHLMPHDWMPEARTVISIASPHTKSAIESNKKDRVLPSIEWLYSRKEGQHYLTALSAMVRDALRADGHKAVSPYADERYKITQFSSNWSDRHVGFLAGLGTFGLSTNFISKIGSAVRLVSVITDWEIEPDEHDYDDWLGYCNRCGVCRRVCPPQALFLDDKCGKDFDICWSHVRKVCEPSKITLACGKCQISVPCASHPMKNTATTT